MHIQKLWGSWVSSAQHGPVPVLQECIAVHFLLHMRHRLPRSNNSMATHSNSHRCFCYATLTCSHHTSPIAAHRTALHGCWTALSTWPPPPLSAPCPVAAALADLTAWAQTAGAGVAPHPLAALQVELSPLIRGCIQDMRGAVPCPWQMHGWAARGACGAACRRHRRRRTVGGGSSGGRCRRRRRWGRAAGTCQHCIRPMTGGCSCGALGGLVASKYLLAAVH